MPPACHTEGTLMTETTIALLDAPTCPSWCTDHRSGGEQGTVFHTRGVGQIRNFDDRRDRADAEPHDLTVTLEQFESWDATARTITVHDVEIVVVTSDRDMHLAIVDAEQARQLSDLLLAAADQLV